MSTTSALSMATSVPAPMAMPMSARASAGASLMPSPTMATRPRSARRRISRSLPSGSTPAITSSAPTSRWMAAAVRSLSPVSITVRMPMALSSATAARLVGFTVSATAITPSSLPSAAKNSGVLPSSARRRARAPISPVSTPCASIMRRLPASTATPSTAADRPSPGTCMKPSTRASAAIPRASAKPHTARASGCSLGCSTASAVASRRSSGAPGAGSTSVTLGVPWVTVPVLSSTTVRTSWAPSSASADFTRMPLLAPRPVPTMMAVGVASPSAQGHDITSTEMACDRADSSPAPSTIHTANVPSAMTMTTGTNTPLMRSAIFSMGALELVASSTRRMMPASVVSSPTRVARMVK